METFPKLPAISSRPGEFRSAYETVLSSLQSFVFRTLVGGERPFPRGRAGIFGGRWGSFVQFREIFRGRGKELFPACD